MAGRFAGTRVLVTGAGSGIGRATAEAFGREGARVAVNYPADPEPARDTVAAIEAAGGAAIAVQGDVSDEDAVARMVRQAVDRFGGLDVAVANAGIQRDAPFLAMSLADWRLVLDVNLTGAFLTAQAAVRQFERQAPPPERRDGCIGSVVFVSSVHETIPWAGHVNYAASKGGVKLLMQSLALELAPRKIRVNAVAPGATRTAINQAEWGTPAGLAGMLGQIPYGRLAEPAEIARAVLWLAGPDADYVVGTTLFVDGGMTLYPTGGTTAP